MMISEIYSIPAVAALCFGFVELLKHALHNDRKVKNAYPLISTILGTVLGVIVYLVEPSFMATDSLLSSALVGMASGLSATGSNEIIQRIKHKTPNSMIADNTPPRYFITGDKHRHFDRLIRFCKDNGLRRRDVIVILGDSGFNYYGDERDGKLKARLHDVDVTLLCLHGNKENRPQNIPTYGIQTFCGGIVYYEPKYPNIFFAKDGEVYDFNGEKFMVIGGAHSVDKLRCLEEGRPFWNDEMPSDEVKSMIESRLNALGHKIDGFLTHTCPISCLPVEMFISTKRTAEEEKTTKHMRQKKEAIRYPLDIDRSTEEWLEGIFQANECRIWYCGHYHVEKKLGKVRMLHKTIIPFCATEEER